MTETTSLSIDTVQTSTIQITNQSILGELRTYEKRYSDAISEFVWNAFDAEASCVDINYSFPEVANGSGFGYPDLEIIDDGTGWDMSDPSLVSTFLDSKKRAHKQSYKSIPHGSKGVGRFTFYAFAKKAEWQTNFNGTSYDLVIEKENISSYTLTPVEGAVKRSKGTSVLFEVNNEALSEAFFENALPKKLLEKFAWFLVLHPEKRIRINSVELDAKNLIENELSGTLNIENVKVEYRLIQWNTKLADKENSKVYFIDNDDNEVFKTPSGLNNKSDIFYHSAYVRSGDFADYSPSAEDMSDKPTKQATIFESTDQAKLIRRVRAKIREALEGFRQPHIEAKSEEIIKAWTEDNIIPDVQQYGIDNEKYEKLIQEIFIIAPNLYLGVSDDHKRVIFNLLASLMGTEDRGLILKILEQIYSLSNEQKEALNQLLERTTLEYILETVKEIEQRLTVIDDLDRLVHDDNLFKKTLEVRHLQQIINQEFWVFGEEYRLVIDTEGSIKKAVEKWAKDILKIEDYDPEADSKKEVDLLLSKKIEYGDRVVNIVVELKRPSVKLGEKEVGQLRNYRKELFKDPVCTGKNIEWVFILVGRDYDNEVERLIESAANHGESYKGLIEKVTTERTRIYVRKWTEIIQGELLPKHRYLKDRLQLQTATRDGKDSSDITESILEGRRSVCEQGEVKV